MIDVLSVVLVVFLHFIFNSLILVEYKNDFKFIEKRWGVLLILLFGWVFLGGLLIVMMTGLFVAILFDSFSLLFKRKDDV